MRELLTILVLLFFVHLNGQEKKYDRFDMNLKGKPVYVKEVSIFSLNDLTKAEYTDILDSSLNSNLFIEEWYFDALGQIERVTRKGLYNCADKLYDSSNSNLLRTEKSTYKDSIVVNKFLISPNPVSTETYHFDINGYLSNKKFEGIHNATWKYKRDKNHRICHTVESSISRDSSSKITSTYNRNETGDIIERKAEKEMLFAGRNNEIEVSLEKYKYIYDENGNWILKTTLVDNHITRITQREIKY